MIHFAWWKIPVTVLLLAVIAWIWWPTPVKPTPLPSGFADYVIHVQCADRSDRDDGAMLTQWVAVATEMQKRMSPTSDAAAMSDEGAVVELSMDGQRCRIGTPITVRDGQVAHFSGGNFYADREVPAFIMVK